MWTCFLFFRVLPRSATVGHILSVYSTWWKTAKPFSGWLNCLAFSPKTVSMPIALHPRQVFYLSCSDRFVVASHLTLICVSPVANDDDKLEHLFICLFAFCMSFLVKCLFSSFVCFLTGCLFSHRWVLRALYTFQTPGLCQTRVLQTLLPGCGFSPHFLSHAFHRAQVFKFDVFQCISVWRIVILLYFLRIFA